jgi:hypothetical protein
VTVMEKPIHLIAHIYLSIYSLILYKMVTCTLVNLPSHTVDDHIQDDPYRI